MAVMTIFRHFLLGDFVTGGVSDPGRFLAPALEPS
jgi:hypothetical protein